MVQELGETVQEMVKDEEKELSDILSQRPTGHYWILIHHKPTKKHLDSGELVIAKVTKICETKPDNLLGTIVLEVKDGQVVDETVNMHDIPIDWWQVSQHAGSEITPYQQKRSDIADSYIYNV